MQTNVLDLRGGVLRSIDLDDRVFGIEPNPAVVHQAVVAQQANARHGTADTKTRGEVAGGEDAGVDARPELDVVQAVGRHLAQRRQPGLLVEAGRLEVAFLG